MDLKISFRRDRNLQTLQMGNFIGGCMADDAFSGRPIRGQVCEMMRNVPQY